VKRRVVAIFIALMALASLVFAGSNGLPSFSLDGPQEQDVRATVSAPPQKKRRDYVDMKSDEGWQMEHLGRKITVVVGHFAAYHNGAVITADSAVRYNERHIECFGNVLIKRGSTYIYGDRAEYDGRTNKAKVFSKIVKVVDGEATLLTYNFEFDTKKSVGRFTGGGVLISGENMLESDRGYVYSDKHEIVCVDKVQMRNEDYELMSDSVVYNTETNYAQFFSRTNIWNKKKDKPEEEDDYLYADRGSYDKEKQLYTLTLNGYVLTKDQELLCDSLYYYRDSDYIRLKRNIQIDDSSQKMLLFGDWAEYWKEPGNVFVTKNPSLISYDLSQSDSVFISSDSMFVYTRYPIREKIEKARKDSLEQVAKKMAAEKGGEKATEKGATPTDKGGKESAQRGENGPQELADSPETKGKRGAESATRRENGRGKLRGAQGEMGRGAQGMPPQQGPQRGTMAPQGGGASAQPAVGSGHMPGAIPTAEQMDSIRKARAKQPKPDSIALAKKRIAAARRAKIDSLAKDTTKQGKKLRAKLLKEEAAEANRATKEAFAKRRERLDSVREERSGLIDRLLGEARLRDAARKQAERERAAQLKDSLKQAKRIAKDSVVVDSVKIDSTKVDTLKLQSLKSDTTKVETIKADSLKGDSLPIDTLKRDSTKVDTLAKFDSMTYKQVKAYFKAIYDAEEAAEERIRQDSLEAKLDRIGLERQAKRTEQYKKWAYRDSVYAAKEREREFERLAKRLKRKERRGIYVAMADSATLALVDSTLLAEFGPLDSLVNHRLDSLIEILFPKPIASPTEVAKQEAENIDSLYREIRAYSHVKMFRSDFQSICDSLTTTTIDSVINMYKSPVMWNGSNQITSEVTHIITCNQKLVRAEFEGSPLTASEIDTAHYNQVTGKEMTAFFRDNKMYRNDVKGNVQTIYFMQEDGSPDITLMAYIEAGDMTAYIENQEVVGITYRGNPTYTFYPMDKIPQTQPTKLPNFKWEASRRPSQDSVFNRTIRPSRRVEKRALSKPLFPIYALMQQRKADYLRRREWRDRTDTLTYETIEWMESIKR
jgi:lipopolysaccharide export system protein LptA